MTPPGHSARLFFLRPLLGAAIAALLIAAPASLPAQAGERMHGRVTRGAGNPAPGVRVQVTSEDGASVETRTDARGLYSLALPGAGPRFVVSAAGAGLAGATRVVTLAPGVRDLTLDLILQAVVALEPVEVRVPRLSVEGATRYTPGTVEQSRLGVELRNEPLGADALSDLTERQTGVAPTTTAMGTGISIAGQAPDQTRLTLDGAALDAVVIPREAIRTINVLTNTFDVGRGQFTGGHVDVRTQQGGNEWGATFRADLADRRLQYGAAPAGLGPGASRLGFDAGAGGALVRDRLFAYLAASGSRTASEAPSIEDVSAEELGRLGLDGDSVARFLGVTRALRPALGAEADAFSSLLSGLLRIDAVLGPRHSMMLRLNGQFAEAPQFQSLLALPGVSSRLRRSDGGAVVQLSSGGARLANQLRIHGSVSARTSTPLDDAPAGAVEVTSEGGAGEGTLLWFAGNPLGQRDVRQRSIEMADEVVLVTPDRAHRFRLGLEGALQSHRGVPTAGSGSFVFRSLAELENGRPALFTRPLATEADEAEGRRVAVFLDDRWNADGFQLSYGVRVERAWYSDGVPPEPGVTSRFGRDPGAVPSPWRVSPRAGFALQARMPWDHAPGATTGIQGGIGRFVGTLALPELAAALRETGTAEAATLVCIGEAAPVPDWPAYRNDPSRVPTSCREGSGDAAGPLPQATLFARGFTPPTAWRASLGGQGLAPGGIFWRVTGAAVWGVRQPVAFDRNLRAQPAFLNAGEGGRAVYADPAGIDTATGLVSPGASRRDADFGIVREMTGEGRSRTFQLSASVNRALGRFTPQVGYTWTDARETVGPLSAVGSAGASAGEDASSLEWTATPYTPRHMAYAAVDWRRSGRLSLGLVGRLSSGTLFTPMVRGDANGDASANDRAFVFDPSDGEAESAGIARLLELAPEDARACLRAQVGRIAAHNSCRTSPSVSLDLRARVQLGPRLRRSPYRRVTLWVVGRNLTSGLDYLLHGPDGLRNWGQAATVDNALLIVRGFDPATRRFRYDVNPHFGRPADRAFLQRAPFSLGLQVRVAVGEDRVDAAFQRMIDANSDRDRAMAPANLALHYARQVPHTAAEVLALNAPRRLSLTPDQALRLLAAADSVAGRRRRLVDALVASVTASREEPGSGGTADLNALVRETVALRRAQVEAVRAILSLEQWRKLPAYLRDASGAFAPYPPERITAPSEY